MTFNEWYIQLKKEAKELGVGYLVSSDQESYKDYFESGETPLDTILDAVINRNTSLLYMNIKPSCLNINKL